MADYFGLSYNFSMPEIYIQRKLYSSDKLVVDSELIGQSGIFVVLAKPGAGKSDLLDFLSRSYGVSREPGNQFVHRHPTLQAVLVIDALDEVARIGEEKINEIIVKARASTASTVIFASRSYVWDQARSAAVRDCFGTEPTILRLEPFDDDEQRELFANYLPSEDFEQFRAEAARFELTPILGNPQFLKLFADAYVEGGRRFTSKKQIYADAVRRLASERLRERQLVRKSTRSLPQPARSSPSCFFPVLQVFLPTKRSRATPIPIFAVSAPTTGLPTLPWTPASLNQRTSSTGTIPSIA